MGSDWNVEVVEGSPRAFHRREIPDAVERTVWVFRPTSSTVVLGSTQDPAEIDHGAARARGLDVVTRRSGGAAVLVTPENLCWIDVIVPRDDPLWELDVGRAAHWVGDTWVRALRSLGLAGLTTHRGPMRRTPWSAHVCFAGVAPGEVVGDRGKTVGLSQRRTRHAARFQTAALVDWRPAPLLAVLIPRPAAPSLLDRSARGTGRPVVELAEAFVDALP